MLPDLSQHAKQSMTEMHIANEFLSKSLYSESALLYRQIYGLSKDPEALYGMSLCAFYENELQKALVLVQELLEIAPEDSRYLNLAGLCAVQTGYLGKAQDLFLASQEHSPSYVEAQRNYGEVLILKGEFQKGFELLIRISKKFPEDLKTLLILAKLSRDIGRKKEAHKYINRVLQLDPNNEQAYRYGRLSRHRNVGTTTECPICLK